MGQCHRPSQPPAETRSELGCTVAPVKFRCVLVERFGGPEVMHLVEDELPTPLVGQARVKILAADVSYSDVNVRRGRYPGGPRPPFTPGYAMVGVVDELGPSTSGPPAGQLVAALTFHGSYGEYMCLAADLLVPIEKAVDPAEAVCLVLG